jgi:hypothetical protein
VVWVNISLWIWQAWSQLGSRLAVASIANIKRPRSWAELITGVDLTFATNASIAALLDFCGRSLSASVMRRVRTVFPGQYTCLLFTIYWLLTYGLIHLAPVSDQ